MKSIQKILSIFLLTVGVVGVFSSCKKDDAPGVPSISYVRVTNPQSSDSLLVAAGQGQLIAIVGENLQDATEIWFNDQQSLLTPTYITNKTILVRVPTQIPLAVNNTMKIVFKNGNVLNHNFQVQISKPIITGIVSEFVNDGDVATIFGNYFYAPVTVIFPGGVNGQIISHTATQIDVTVPAGAQPGQLIVKTNFGEGKSDFLFRDPRPKLITGDDPPLGWWPTYLVTNPGPNDPPKISGNYYRFKKQVKDWNWDAPEVAGGPASAYSTSKNIPDAAILKPEDYFVKFEVNTMKPYNANRISFNVGLTAEDNDAYVWAPPFDTKGKWVTVSIPFEDMVRSYKTKPVISPSGYWTRILIFGPGDFDADISFDNLRVVPKKAQ